MENVFGLLGLALIVFAVAAVAARARLGRRSRTSWSPSTSRATRSWHVPGPTTRSRCSAPRMTPYEVFFFSSGGVEERWTAEGHRDDAGQRVHRLPARRRALAGDRRLRGGGLRPAGHRGRHARARSGCRSRSRSARSGWRSRCIGLRRGDVRRGAARPGCRSATASRSTSAGSGASTSGRAAAAGSTSSCCCRAARRGSACC